MNMTRDTLEMVKSMAMVFILIEKVQNIMVNGSKIKDMVKRPICLQMEENMKVNSMRIEKTVMVFALGETVIGTSDFIHQ